MGGPLRNPGRVGWAPGSPGEVGWAPRKSGRDWEGHLEVREESGGAPEVQVGSGEDGRAPGSLGGVGRCCEGPRMSGKGRERSGGPLEVWEGLGGYPEVR